MMKAILGSAIGGVVAGVLALMASAQGRSAPEATWPGAAQANNPYAMTVADTRSFNSASTTAPTHVQCEPHQEAVLQRSFVAGREVAQVTCASRMMPQAAYAPPSSYAPAGAVPAAGYYAQPVAAAPDIVQRPARTQTVRPRAQRVRYTQPREEVKPNRSWKKTAVVIGAGTGAGAGIGALAGGKKGALIGAAVGGGAATVYEVIKRK